MKGIFTMYKKLFQMLTFSVCIYTMTECKAENLCPKYIDSCQCLSVKNNKWQCYSNTGLQIWPVSEKLFNSEKKCKSECPLTNY